MTIQVMLADDHAMLREGLRVLLEAQPDMTVIGEAGTGREALRLIRGTCPDILLIDISMPELNGIEAARQVGEICPDTALIILSMHANRDYVVAAFQAGARGYVLKESAGQEVIDAVRATQAGRRYLSQKISDLVLDDFLIQRQSAGADDPLSRLSEREREILVLVVEGRSSAEIADLLALSPKTVETYRSRLMDKLGITNLPDLVRFAIRHGLISAD